MKLSLTLPTLFPGPAARIIENVRATVRDLDYEIVVVGPFEVSGPNIRWVREETPRGSAVASATAYEHATGDVICPLTDDIELGDGWAAEGLQALLKFERGRPYAIGIGQTNQIVGTVFGIYYPFFPMVRRATLDLVGGFFSPEYKHSFTDADFAFRIWSAGAPAATPNAGTSRGRPARPAPRRQPTISKRPGSRRPSRIRIVSSVCGGRDTGRVGQPPTTRTSTSTSMRSFAYSSPTGTRSTSTTSCSPRRIVGICGTWPACASWCRSTLRP